MNALPPGSTIGIVGGGQLGRMLAMAAARLGYRTVILEPQPDCPAAQVAGRQITAAYDDPGALEAMAVASDVVTYEFENVPVAAAQRLARAVPVHPAPLALEKAQDRLAEKQFLNGIGIPTAAFRDVENVDDLAAGLESFGGRGILKTRRLGYDGKGQIRFRGDGTDLDPAAALAAIGARPAVLEAFVPFEREISVIVARGADGAVASYDPAENIHVDGILSTSSVPARIGPGLAAAARDAAARLADALGYVGVLGLELFVLPEGVLLANEYAPRVHNSGHWTEAACAVSQFEQHVRAIAGLPLGDPRRHSDCVMHNLIGDDVRRAAGILAEPDAVLHLYGKADARPGRKMGHVTRLRSRI